MSAMMQYMDRAEDPEKKEFIRKQHEESHTGTITCSCGWKRDLTMAFKCLYCGLWFCHPCAEQHFGQTVGEWLEERRLKKLSKSAVDIAAK